MMLIRREFRFSAAHRIRLDGRKCENLHGHNYRLIVTLTGTPDERGLIIDFAHIKEIVEKEVISKIDHVYLNDLLEQPTLENLAVWIWERLKKTLEGPNYSLYEIEIFETPNCSILYRGGKI